MDAGPGSLRDAIERANSLVGSDLAVISFSIPTTDPGYVDVDSHRPDGDPDPDVFVIRPLTELPALTRGNTIINGQSQQTTSEAESPATEFRFTGRITSVDAPLVDSFAVETPLTVNVTFDPTFPDTDPAPEHGQYFNVPPNPANFGAVSQLTATIGAYSALSPDGVINVYNDFTNQAGFTLDSFNVGASNIHGLLGPSLGDYNLQAVGVNLVDFQHAAFSDDRIKTNLDLAAFPNPAHRQFNMLFLTAGNEFAYVRGEITGIENNAGGETGSPTSTLGASNPFGPEIVVNGSGVANRADGLHLDSDNNRVHGLTIQQFTNNGILVTGNENELTGNYVGTTSDGMAAMGNRGNGIAVQNSAGNLIGGSDASDQNVVSGNFGEGIEILGSLSDNNLVQGNYIGVNGAGTAAIGNHKSGIFVPGATNTQILNNVVSGNLGFAGIAIYGGNPATGDAAGTVIQGNFVGTDVHGNRAIPNSGRGISINDTVGSLIGGSEIGDENTISGNLGEGIEILGTLSDNNIVQGNYIGVDESGTAAIGNHKSGIFVPGATNTQILNNVVSGNLGFAGIAIYGGNPATGDAAGTVIQGNFVGTDVHGNRAIPNLGHGVSLNSTVGSQVGGTETGTRNVISGNVGNGVSILGGGEHIVAGNLIGIGGDGVTDLGNFDGILLTSTSHVQIGGTVSNSWNVISGNDRYGIGVGASAFTTIQGNRIGTDLTGETAVGNGLTGVELIGHATDTQIGGVAPNSGNVISGNVHGVRVAGAGATVQTNIQGNKIGTNVSGERALANQTGIQILATGGSIVRDVVIGGETSDAGNVISGNTIEAIRVVGTSADEHVRILGNWIGSDPTGLLQIPNGDGVVIDDATGVIIGGIGAGQGNTIAYNDRNGIVVIGDASTGNTIRGNSIYANGGIGIDLGNDDVTPNDDGDTTREPLVWPDEDKGPNELQNSPDLTSAANGNTTRVSGQLRSEPDSTFTIDFYANAVADPTEFGEGQRWLGFIEVTTDTLGVTGFSTVVADAVVDEYITATATNAAGSTSEFSNARIVRGRPVRDQSGPPPTSTNGEDTVDSNSPLLVTLQTEQSVSTPIQPTSNLVDGTTKQRHRATQLATVEMKVEVRVVEPELNEPPLRYATAEEDLVDLIFADFEDLFGDALLAT
jgi:hypothetical protein